MALNDQIGRWPQRTAEVRDLLAPVLDSMPSTERVLRGQILGAMQGLMEDHVHAAEVDLPQDDTPLDAVVARFVTGLHKFLAVTDAPDTTAELRTLLSDLHETARDTHLALTTDDRLSAQTVDEVIEDFAQEYRISLLLTLTAPHALTQTVTEWQRKKGANTTEGDHLDVATMKFVASDDNGTIPMPVLASLITASPTVMTPSNAGSVFEEMMTGGTPSSLYRLAYAHWFTSIIAAWEDVYRPRLAIAHGTGPDGEKWLKNDVRSEFLYEIAQIRHDFEHKAGICIESADNTHLNWTKPREPIAPTPRQMLSLLDSFPYDELRQTPSRTERTTERLPYQFPSDWIERVKSHVTAIQPARKQRPAVLMQLIDEWMRDRDAESRDDVQPVE